MNETFRFARQLCNERIGRRVGHAKQSGENQRWCENANYNYEKAAKLKFSSSETNSVGKLDKGLKS
jgi:hypothetical protein